jgi:hypothetical protein
MRGIGRTAARDRVRSRSAIHVACGLVLLATVAAVPIPRRAAVAATLTTISGTVTGPGGAPVANVQVSARRTEFANDASAITDATGGYVLTLPGAGAYKLQFFSGPYVTEWYNDKSSFATADSVSVADAEQRTGINAQLAQGATINGTVTASNGSPLSQICVFAQQTQFGAAAASATTTGDGTYSLTHLAAGTYRIQFQPCSTSPSDRLTQWYRGKSTFAAADPVTVDAGQLVSGIDAQLIDGGSISGAVRNATGTGIPGICVSATSVSDPTAGKGITTDSSGGYTLHALAPGQYRVSFTNCNGATDYVSEWFDDAASRDTAAAVTVAANAVTAGIDAVLAVGGSISGTVTDTSGQPLDGICATAILGNTGSNVGRTNGAGQYAVRGLRSGDYRISFSDCAGGNYVQTYYPDARSFDSGAIVTVEGTNAVTAINQTLELGGAVAGSVVADGGGPLSGICVNVRDTAASASSNGQTTTDGTYVVHGVPAGTHQILFSDCTSSGDYIPEYYDNVPLPTSTTPAATVPVQPGVVTQGINAALALGGSVSGLVVGENDEPLNRICVSGGTAIAASTNSSGEYRLRGIPTGAATIAFNDCSGTTNYLREWYDNQPTAAAANPVPVDLGANTPGINARLTEGGSVSGIIVNQSNQPAAGACAFAFVNQSFWSSSLSDAAGHYRLRSLPTGTVAVAFGESAIVNGFPSCRTRDISSWYDNQTSVTSATPVTVAKAADRGGVNGKIGDSLGVPPNPPTDLIATAFDRRAAISWTPPAFTGSGPVTGYTVTANPGGATAAAGASDTSAEVAGLTNGVTYTFTVRASNAAGPSASSTPSNAVTPIGPSTVTLTPSTATAVWGQPVTLTARVSSASGAPGTPSGNVTFYDTGFVLGTAALDATGTAELTVNTLAMGGHTLSATYDGDIAFLPATSPSVSHLITKAQSAVTVTPAQNPAQYGGTTFTFVVGAVSPGAGTASGTITIYEGGTPLYGTDLDDVGHATVTIRLPVGIHNLTAVYSGDPHFVGSSSSASWTVIKANTTLRLTASSATGDTQTPVTLLAELFTEASPNRSGDATGVVEFLDGTTTLGTATLDHAHATTTVTLPEGTHELTARYPGDNNFNASESKPVPIFISHETGPNGPGAVGGPGIPIDYPAAVPYRTIHSRGPLTDVTVTAQLGCSIHHIDDQYAAFFNGVAGCGTFASVGDVTYGPAFLAKDRTGITPYTMVSQTDVLGSGTEADPYRIVTVVDAGRAVRITQTDSYVVGQESYSTRVAVENRGNEPTSVGITHAGDCYVADNDQGFGYVDYWNAAPACRAAVSAPDGPTALDRTLTWRPEQRQGASYFEGSQLQWPNGGGNDCRCDEYLDNAAGIHIAVAVGPRQTETVSHSTGFEAHELFHPSNNRDPQWEAPTPLDGARFDMVLPASTGFFLKASDPDGDPVAIKWELRPVVGFGEPQADGVTCRALPQGNEVACAVAPTKNGLAQLQVSATDGKGGWADFRSYLVGASVYKYVDLGDSYSSGEGLDPYFRDGYDWRRGAITGRVDNRCHRSKFGAHSERVVLPGDTIPVFEQATAGDLNERYAPNRARIFWACAGAETKHLTQEAPHEDRYPELDNDAVDASTDLVTLTIGGNDVGFSEIMQRCATDYCLDGTIDGKPFSQGLEDRVTRLRNDLRTVLREIRRRTFNARVLLLGYPHLLPDAYAGRVCAYTNAPGQFGYDSAEQAELYRLTDLFNDALGDVARSSGAEFVDVRELFAGHEACGSHAEWINGPSLTTKLIQKGWKKPPASLVDDETFHPNPTGQCMYAVAVNRHLGTAEPPC